MDDDEFEGLLTETIDLVSHDTRARTLVALAARHREAPRAPTLRFSDLRERVGHDDPGNFNYHLQRLTGSLVESTEEGYRLSDVGHAVVGALLSGRLDPGAELDLPETTTPCPVCGDPAPVSYADGMLRIDCEDHGARMDVGPDLLDRRSVEGAVDLALLASLFDARLATYGLCPNCGGEMAGGLTTTDDDDRPVVYAASCKRCGATVRNTVGGCVLDHPAVVALCYDHGLDIREDARRVLTEHVARPEVVDEDPLRVAVAVVFDDRGLELHLDATGDVVAVRDRDPA